jgi:hypothetical protein
LAFSYFMIRFLPAQSSRLVYSQLASHTGQGQIKKQGRMTLPFNLVNV